MKDFAIYLPARQCFIGEDGRLTPWNNQARSFPSKDEANSFITRMGWENSTWADKPRAAYAVEFIS